MASTNPPHFPSLRQRAQMLFLASHGLQTPISAIRWGCSRLKKNTEGFSQEQVRLLDGIQSQAKMLSHMMDALLLVARVEDGTYMSREQDIYLHDFLVSFQPLKELLAKAPLSVSCPDDLLLRADRDVLESLFHAFIVIFATASTPDAPPVRVQVQDALRDCSIQFHPPVELSFLRDLAAPKEDGVSPELVGGSPGLMLSIASSLSSFLGGSVEVRKHDAQHYALSLRLPLHPTVRSQKASVSASS